MYVCVCVYVYMIVYIYMHIYMIIYMFVIYFTAATLNLFHFSQATNLDSFLALSPVTSPTTSLRRKSHQMMISFFSLPHPETHLSLCPASPFFPLSPKENLSSYGWILCPQTSQETCSIDDLLFLQQSPSPSQQSFFILNMLKSSSCLKSPV